MGSTEGRCCICAIVQYLCSVELLMGLDCYIMFVGIPLILHSAKDMVWFDYRL